MNTGGNTKNKPRGILIAGNWKMNNGLKATEQFFQDVQVGLKNSGPLFTSAKSLNELFKTGRLQACVVPPALSLEKAVGLAKQFAFPFHIAAQNVHWEKNGAFTGEISGPMALELGVNWALVGHSERRQYFAESNETVRKRAESLLLQGFRVILCIGETKTEREQGKTGVVLVQQITEALPERGKGAAAFLDGRLVLAYEPVWAIGTGLTATPAQAQEAHLVIRSLILEKFGPEAAEKTPILYGGSVTPGNISELLLCKDIDGALVGGASLKPESFLALLTAGAQAVQ